MTWPEGSPRCRACAWQGLRDELTSEGNDSGAGRCLPVVQRRLPAAMVGKCSERSCMTRVRLGNRHDIEMGKGELGKVAQRKGVVGGGAAMVSNIGGSGSCSKAPGTFSTYSRGNTVADV
jgi:hypothetical protein